LTITTPKVDASKRSEPSDFADQLGHDTATAKKNLTGDARVTEQGLRMDDPLRP
jgi:hypothetical protein